MSGRPHAPSILSRRRSDGIGGWAVHRVGNYKHKGGWMAAQLLKNSMNTAARYENSEVKVGVNCLQNYKLSTIILNNEQIQ